MNLIQLYLWYLVFQAQWDRWHQQNITINYHRREDGNNHLA